MTSLINSTGFFLAFLEQKKLGGQTKNGYKSLTQVFIMHKHQVIHCTDHMSVQSFTVTSVVRGLQREQGFNKEQQKSTSISLCFSCGRIFSQSKHQSTKSQNTHTAFHHILFFIWFCVSVVNVEEAKGATVLSLNFSLFERAED